MIVKYGLFTISLKKKKGSYDFFSRSYGLSKLSMHFCALPPTLALPDGHKEVAGRILPIVCVCVCVCVLLGGEVKMFKNVYFRSVFELPLPYVHAYWWWKATICAHETLLKRSIITISSFVSNNTIQ